MKGRFVILILAALFAVTCSKISQVTADDPWIDLNGDKPVRFDSGVLTKTSLPSNTSFGVFAFLQNGVIGSYTGRWADLASKHWKPNFMYNEEVDFDGADYSYSPVRYWPSNSENTITFWAYWPYNSDVSMVNSSGLSDYSASSEGLPNIRYTVTDGKTDFMVSDVVADQSRPTVNSPVNFTFHHALSKIDFTVLKDDAGDDFEVHLSSISLEDMYLTGINRSDGWTNHSGGLRSLTAYSGSQTVTASETAVSGSSVMVIPQALERPLQGNAVMLRIVYTLRGAGMSTTKTNASLIALTGSWARDTHYTYKITITPNLPIEFTVSWTDWGDAEHYFMSN